MTPLRDHGARIAVTLGPAALVRAIASGPIPTGTWRPQAEGAKVPFSVA
jgi:hypothetical protein